MTGSNLPSNISNILTTKFKIYFKTKGVYFFRIETYGKSSNGLIYFSQEQTKGTNALKLKLMVNILTNNLIYCRIGTK